MKINLAVKSILQFQFSNFNDFKNRFFLYPETLWLLTIFNPHPLLVL